MTSSAAGVLADRLELAAQVVRGTELGRRGLRHRERRILIRLEFVLRLWGWVFDRRLLRNRRFFRQRWWRSWRGHRLRGRCPLLRQLTLHLFSYVQGLLQSGALQLLLQLVVVVLVAVHVWLHLFAFRWNVLPFLWDDFLLSGSLGSFPLGIKRSGIQRR